MNKANIVKSSFLDIVAEGLQDKNTADSYATYTYEPEVEILSMTDERLKILGEELSNDTSRAILNCIFEGKRTTGEIANTLNLSLPLVIYHIERLLKTNIIKIANVELNSKGREKKVYDAKRAAIIIQLNPKDTRLRQKLQRLFILSAAVAAIGAVSAIWQVADLQNQVQAIVTDPDRPTISLSPIIPVVLSGIGGAASAVLAWAIGRMKRRK